MFDKLYFKKYDVVEDKWQQQQQTSMNNKRRKKKLFFLSICTSIEWNR